MFIMPDLNIALKTTFFGHRFVARYKLQMGNENESVQVLISNRKIYFMKNMNDVILQVSYESLIGCHWMAKGW